MDVRILGPLEVEGAEGPIALPRGRAAALFAMLAIHAGTVVSSDRLIDELWGSSPPATARTKLQGLVATLRKRLEPERRPGEQPRILLTNSPGYLLDIELDRVDAHRFRRMVIEATNMSPFEQVHTLQAALDLWRGEALADFAYEPFAQSEISALESMRLVALGERIEADLSLHRHEELVPELEELIRDHPFRETFRGQLMVAYYRSGRQADALRFYHETQRILREELGVDPTQSLQELERAILHQDPKLDPGPPSSAKTTLGAEGTAWMVEGRKTVTVVLTEFLTSDDRSDPERKHIAVREAQTAATELLEEYGGKVQGSLGGLLVTVFGVPHAHEDDALRAARACVRFHKETAGTEVSQTVRPRVGVAARSGIDTGEVITGDPSIRQLGISGNVVTAADALRREAGPGKVLIGAATRELLGDAVLAVPVESSVVDEQGVAIEAWNLEGVIPGARPRQPRPDSPMIGRDAEFEWLARCLHRARDKKSSELALVLGEAGLGKTRLAMDFSSNLGSDVTVLTGRCQAFGERTTFWPVSEIVAGAAGGLDQDAIRRAMPATEDSARTAELLATFFDDAMSNPRGNSLFSAVKEFLSALAGQQPLVVIFEDVHWAQQTFLDLVEYLAGSVDHGVLILCLARPEFTQMRPAWFEVGGVASWLNLEPLDDDHVENLIAHLTAGRPMIAETQRRVVELAQGNPLFVGQMLAALRDDSTTTIPATLQALLNSRLDALGPAERDLIKAASVLGEQFTLSLLTALLPKRAQPSAQRHLQRLTDRKLVAPHPDNAAHPEGYGFGHALIRLAAYRSMTKEGRAHLHERVAGVIEQGEAAIDADVDRLIGFHLEQAFRFRDELGQTEGGADTLAARAGESLARAGLREFARFDAEGAEDLLARAGDLLPLDHSEMWEVKQKLAEAHQTMGRHGKALDVISEMLSQTEDDRLEHALRLERARTILAIGSDDVALEEITGAALRAKGVFEAAGDRSGLAQAMFTLAEVELQNGHVEESERLARLALDNAKASDNMRYALGAMRLIATTLLTGPVPVPEALSKCEGLTWRGKRNAAVLPVLGQLQAMAGDFQMAREMIRQARRILIETARARRPLSLVGRRAAEIEFLAGDLAAAEQELRRTLDLDLTIDVRNEASLVAAMLCTTLLEQERQDEAESMAEIAQVHAPGWSAVAKTTAAAARARLSASRGEFEEAELLATCAVEGTPDQMPGLRADRLVDLATVLIAAGQSEPGAKAIETATHLYEQKGNIAALHRARQRIPSLR